VASDDITTERVRALLAGHSDEALRELLDEWCPHPGDRVLGPHGATVGTVQERHEYHPMCIVRWEDASIGSHGSIWENDPDLRPVGRELLAAAPSIARAYLESAAEVERLRAVHADISEGLAEIGMGGIPTEAGDVADDAISQLVAMHQSDQRELKSIGAFNDQLRAALHEALDGWGHPGYRDDEVGRRFDELRKLAGERAK
jgi:hypothetical protein